MYKYGTGNLQIAHMRAICSVSTKQNSLNEKVVVAAVVVVVVVNVCAE